MRVEESRHERDLVFKYDATGNRILKIAISKGQNATIRATSYHRDAQGNVLSTEESDAVPTSTTSPIPTTREYTLYGSSRLGVFKTYALGTTPQVGDYYMTKTDKYYELTNHLGNVMAVLSDAKHYDDNAQHYTTLTAQAQDYMPFGMLMPGRKYTNTSLVEKYRYGFGGHEKVDEVKGTGNHYTSTFWEMDPRLARRWNPDPVIKFHESPYAILANNPIWFVDPNGADTLDIMKNDAGKWVVSNTQIVKGDDVFRVKVGDETKTYTFSEGEYGERFNVLNLETKGDHKTGYTLGIYHISGADGEGSVGYVVTPGGEPSTVAESNKRLPDDVYTITPTNSHNRDWVQPLITIGENSGNVSGRGTKIHPAPSPAAQTRVNQWTKSCFVVSTDYSIKNGQVFYNSKQSMQTSKQVNTFLGATKHYGSVGNKNYPGSDFGNGINFKLIQKSGF